MPQRRQRVPNTNKASKIGIQMKACVPTIVDSSTCVFWALTTKQKISQLQVPNSRVLNLPSEARRQAMKTESDVYVIFLLINY
jgi:hypothetical protein